MTNPLQEAIQRVLTEYPKERKKRLKDNPLAKFIRVDLRGVVEEALAAVIQESDLIVAAGSLGGRWPHVPRFSIEIPRPKNSTRPAIHVYCLFSGDGNAAVLAVTVGMTSRSADPVPEIRKKMLAAVPLPAAFEEGPLPAGTLGPSFKSDSYEAAVLCYTTYDAGKIPTDAIITRHIRRAINFVNQLVETSAFAELSFQRAKSRIRADEIESRPVLTPAVATYSKGQDTVVPRQYWALGPDRNTNRWPQMKRAGEIRTGWDRLGDLSRYESSSSILEQFKKVYSRDRDPTVSVRCNWDFSNVMRIGDIVFVWQGRNQLIGLGEITSGCRWDESKAKFRSVRSVKWHRVGHWLLPAGDRFSLQTLTNITASPGMIARLNELVDFPVDLANPTSSLPEAPRIAPIYTLEMLSAESGHTMENLHEMRERLLRKRHLVLKGPPGTGKSFIAQRLADALISGTTGVKEMIQFHPAYSYEDFVQGIRPQTRADATSYVLTPGHFLQFCARAKAARAPSVLIIDEINRANCARVFGELMFLLEYRGKSVPLAAGGAQFSIPENVLIIATMNTADRSIALADHALQRRFTFVTLAPDYEILSNYLQSHGLPAQSLVQALKMVNEAIADPNYYVGISYFLKDGRELGANLRRIWEGELEPYLDEYFHDRRDVALGLRFSVLSQTVLKEWA